MLDLAPWLSPIDGANPSGRDLYGDQRFAALQRMMEPRSEVARDPRTNAPVSETPVPVDWAAVLAAAEGLRAEGRDLRLLVIVARAMTNERGFAGLADGLSVIAGTLEAHWETLHPQLGTSPQAQEAAVRRKSTLLLLERDRENDGLLADLRKRAAFVARGFGPVTGRDLERAALDSHAALTEAAPGMGDKERAAFLSEHEQLLSRVAGARAALADQSPGELDALVAGLRSASEALAGLEHAVSERLGSALPLSNLARSLERMRRTLELATPQAQETPAATAAEAGEPAAVVGTVAAAVALPGLLRSRQDVVDCLDRIIEFYDRTEPASPVPYLAHRMRLMVPMDFLELLEDLAPSGLKEFRLLAGLLEDKKSASRNQG